VIDVTRPVHVPLPGHPHVLMSEGAGRPLPGGAPMITAPLPIAIPGAQPYCGMDPSNQSTWVRQYNPQPGMIGRLNYDGAAIQGDTDMGGVWSNPAGRDAVVGARPSRRRGR
jgi:hypothetical protein